MCIWKCAKKNRRCEYCTYDGGCEARDKPDRVDAGEYSSVMSGIIGCDILSNNRRDELVCARALVAYQMRMDGMSFTEIGRMLRRDHATAMYYVEKAKDIFRLQNQYMSIIWIWRRFQKELSLQKPK